MVNNSLLLQNHREKKKSDCLLEGLSSALPPAPAPKPPKSLPKQPTIKTNSQKQKISITEKEHFKLVLSHPTFQSNPFETIKLHLNNTIENDREEEKKGEKLKEKVKRNGSRKRPNKL